MFEAFQEFRSATKKKMASVLNVYSRLPSKTSRFQISVDNFEQDSDTVISAISKEISTAASDFDVLYAGKVLRAGNLLSNYLLQEHSTLYVVRKFTSLPQDQTSSEARGSSVHTNEAILAVQSALLNQDYRSTVERVLLNAESVENVIAATPGLDKDPAVLLLLQDPELLAILAHPNNLPSLLQHHPSFAQAAVTVATVVNEESAKSGMKATVPGTITYSLDQMSEDEDDYPAQPPNRPTRGTSGGGQGITATQLAAALQTAAGASGQSSSNARLFPSPFQNTPGTSGSGSTITSDFFQQAMAHAQSASSDAALQQLRDMGITDDNVARQALAATNGDIQAAIDLIFGDGLM